jgi:hypothetical protein
MNKISDDLQKLSTDFDEIYNNDKLPKPSFINAAKKLLDSIHISTDAERALKHDILCKIEELKQRNKSPSSTVSSPAIYFVGKNGNKKQRTLGEKFIPKSAVV